MKLNKRKTFVTTRTVLCIIQRLKKNVFMWPINHIVSLYRTNVNDMRMHHSNMQRHFNMEQLCVCVFAHVCLLPKVFLCASVFSDAFGFFVGPCKNSCCQVQLTNTCLTVGWCTKCHLYKTPSSFSHLHPFPPFFSLSHFSFAFPFSQYHPLLYRFLSLLFCKYQEFRMVPLPSLGLE